MTVEIIVAGPGLETATPSFAVKLDPDCARRPGNLVIVLRLEESLDILHIHLCFLSRKGEYSIKEAIIAMFKCRSFYILWLTILCLECSLQYCNGLYKVGVKAILKFAPQHCIGINIYDSV